MFVSTPLSIQQREELKRKADLVRDEMLHRADPELLRVLRERGVTQLGGTNLEVAKDMGDDWVRVTPGSDGPFSIAGQSQTLLEGHTVPEAEGRKTARDLISEFDKERSKDDMVEKKTRTGKRKKAVTEEKKPSAVKKGVVKKPRKKEKHVEVINVVEPGVYEIDVKGLLEDNPIIIQNDGTYLIHLPSLLKDPVKKDGR